MKTIIALAILSATLINTPAILTRRIVIPSPRVITFDKKKGLFF